MLVSAQSSKRQTKNSREKWALFMGAMTGIWCVQDQQPYKLSYDAPCVPAFHNNFHPFLTLKYSQWCCRLSMVSLGPLTKFLLTSPLKAVHQCPREPRIVQCYPVSMESELFPQQLLLWAEMRVCLLLQQYQLHCPLLTDPHLRVLSTAMEKDALWWGWLALQARERPGKQLR